MKSFIVIPAILLASLCCCSGSNTVKVKPGEDAILTCRNVLSKPAKIFWGRLVSSENYSCIIDGDSTSPKFCSGFKDERFEPSSNNSFVSLKIKHVKMADSGFYFCGFNVFGNGEIDVVQLNVEDDILPDNKTGLPDNETGSKCESDITLWMSMILGGLCLLLIMAIVRFALKVKKLQTAQNQEHNEPRVNLASDNLNYAALNFKPKAKRTHRAVSNDPNVIYAATR